MGGQDVNRLDVMCESTKLLQHEKQDWIGSPAHHCFLKIDLWYYCIPNVTKGMDEWIGPSFMCTCLYT
jgi:hypothetical protein